MGLPIRSPQQETAGMPKLSALADEISTDLDEQIATLQANGVDHIALRGVFGKGVLKLTEDEVRDVKRRASDAGIGFSSIGSPLGKFPLDGDFAEQLDGLRKALDYAAILDAPFIRMFSFHIPKGDDPAQHRAQVMDWLGQMAALAESTDVMLCHENEKGIYGDTGDRCLDIHETIPSASLGCIFDFANYVQCGERPYTDCWTKLRDHVTYFHVKDAVLESRQVVPLGQGDGDAVQILAEAFAAGFDGYMVIEHHLKAETGLYGSTKPELFATAAAALRDVIVRASA